MVIRLFWTCKYWYGIGLKNPLSVWLRRRSESSNKNAGSQTAPCAVAHCQRCLCVWMTDKLDKTRSLFAICGVQEHFHTAPAVDSTSSVSPACSVPDRERPYPHPRHGKPAHRHPVHHSGGALPAGGSHLLQPARHAPLPDQRDPAPPSHSGCGAVRGLQPGLRRGGSAAVLMHFKQQYTTMSVSEECCGGCRYTGRSLSLYMLLQDS